jgi:hypothetical protein
MHIGMGDTDAAGKEMEPERTHFIQIAHVPFVITPTHPSRRWMFAITSPKNAPTPGGSSMSCNTIMRGSGISRMCFQDS